MSDEAEKVERKKKKSAGGDWVGYRPEIAVLDCTIRDEESAAFAPPSPPPTVRQNPC